MAYKMVDFQKIYEKIEKRIQEKYKKEEPVVEEAPKKKRGRKKKATLDE